jgi:hypothetical protein
VQLSVAASLRPLDSLRIISLVFAFLDTPLADADQLSAIDHQVEPIDDATSAPYATTMSFSSLVQDLSMRSAADARNRENGSTTSAASTVDGMASRTSHISRAMSYTSTAATSVSISGDISSQLHGGYSHALARQWQAERQLTKVRGPV